MTSGIYGIKYNNSYYVGSSKNIELRVKTHWKQLDRNKHTSSKLQELYNLTASFTNSWEYIILQEVEDACLSKYEQSWVTYLESNGCIILNTCRKISKNPISLGTTVSFRSYHEQQLFNALQEI